MTIKTLILILIMAVAPCYSQVSDQNIKTSYVYKYQFALGGNYTNLPKLDEQSKLGWNFGFYRVWRQKGKGNFKIGLQYISMKSGLNDQRILNIYNYLHLHDIVGSYGFLEVLMRTSHEVVAMQGFSVGIMGGIGFAEGLDIPERRHKYLIGEVEQPTSDQYDFRTIYEGPGPLDNNGFMYHAGIEISTEYYHLDIVYTFAPLYLNAAARSTPHIDPHRKIHALTISIGSGI